MVIKLILVIVLIVLMPMTVFSVSFSQNLFHCCLTFIILITIVTVIIITIVPFSMKIYSSINKEEHKVIMNLIAFARIMVSSISPVSERSGSKTDY